MDEFEQQAAAGLIELSVQAATELVFTIYRRYGESEVIKGKIVKIEGKMARIAVNVLNDICIINFYGVLEIKKT
ncbi:hypothetical protein [Bacillus cereus]|uniref:hypothetical protein n=1 Tax=Bacillus cereus TaxID=1396 RepID=UPI00211F0DBC|nr:hypothetical protein [Bacillus cereus]